MAFSRLAGLAYTKLVSPALYLAVISDRHGLHQIIVQFILLFLKHFLSECCRWYHGISGSFLLAIVFILKDR